MKLFTTLFTMLLLSSAYAQKESQIIKAFNNGFSMSIPGDVDSMSAETIATKYRKRPDGKTYYYGDEDASFSIVITAVTDGVKEEEMVKHKDDLTRQFSDKGYNWKKTLLKK